MEEKSSREIVNQSVKELGAISTEIPKLCQSSRVQSEQSLQFSFTAETEKQNSEIFRKRVDLLSSLKLSLTDSLQKFQTSFDRLRDHIELIACDPSQQTNLSEGAKMLLRLFQQRQRQGGQDPFGAHQDLMDRVTNLIYLIDCLVFVHSQTMTELVEFLQQTLSSAHEKLFQDDPSEQESSGGNAGQIMWVWKLCSLRGIEKMKDYFVKEQKAIAHVSNTNKSKPVVCCLNELQLVLDKLSRCRGLIFTAGLKNLSDSSGGPASSLNLNVDPSKNYVVSRFFEPSLPFEVNYMTSKQILRESFRETLSYFYRVADITGDGNCFFRAVIKFLFPSIPRDHEDSLSLELRELANLNVAINEKFQAFEEVSENDSQTMLQSGVWADHIQVKKLSEYLKRPLWLVRYDDIQLSMDSTNNTIPGESYRIGGPPIWQKVPPNAILLLYSPDPGHYEALIPKGEPLTIKGALEVCSRLLTKRKPASRSGGGAGGSSSPGGRDGGSTPFFSGMKKKMGLTKNTHAAPSKDPQPSTQASNQNQPIEAQALEWLKAILEVYFLLENEAERLQILFVQYINSTEEDALQPYLAKQLSVSLEDIFPLIVRFREYCVALDLNDQLDCIKAVPEYPLFKNLVSPLANDEVSFHDPARSLARGFRRVREVGTGSLSQLILRLKNFSDNLQPDLFAVLSPPPSALPRNPSPLKNNNNPTSNINNQNNNNNTNNNNTLCAQEETSLPSKMQKLSPRSIFEAITK